VARRPEPETILTREQLAEFTRKLAMLSDDGVERIYEETYRECAYRERILPPAAAIQQLVAAWKVLRKFRAMSGSSPGIDPYYLWLLPTFAGFSLLMKAAASNTHGNTFASLQSD